MTNTMMDITSEILTSEILTSEILTSEILAEDRADIFTTEIEAYIEASSFEVRLQALARQIEDLQRRLRRHLAGHRWAHIFGLTPAEAPLWELVLYSPDAIVRSRAADALCGAVCRLGKAA